FARPGFASRHNTSYWDGSDYLGLGAGAHSFSAEPAPGRRWTNERLPERYVAAVRERGTAVATEERLSPAQARGEFCFTGLRQAAGVDLERFRRRFGVALDAAFPHLERLIADGRLEAARQDAGRREPGRVPETAQGEERVPIAQAQRRHVRARGGTAHDKAEEVVGEQQAPHFLLDAGRGLTAQRFRALEGVRLDL